jgi:hypothetical protein
VGETFGEAALSGALVVSIPVAVAAGLVSLLSPCVLPLVPGYLSYVTGLSGFDLAGARRARVVLGALLFVVGFTAVFISYGALFGGLGATLRQYGDPITRVLGVVTIVLGLAEGDPTAPHLDGVELHDASATATRDLLRSAGVEAHVRVGDFFTFDPTGSYDTVIGTRPTSAVRNSPASPAPGPARPHSAPECRCPALPRRGPRSPFTPRSSSARAGDSASSFRPNS